MENLLSERSYEEINEALQYKFLKDFMTGSMDQPDYIKISRAIDQVLIYLNDKKTEEAAAS